MLPQNKNYCNKFKKVNILNILSKFSPLNNLELPQIKLCRFNRTQKPICQIVIFYLFYKEEHSSSKIWYLS